MNYNYDSLEDFFEKEASSQAEDIVREFVRDVEKKHSYIISRLRLVNIQINKNNDLDGNKFARDVGNELTDINSTSMKILRIEIKKDVKKKLINEFIEKINGLDLNQIKELKSEIKEIKKEED